MGRPKKLNKYNLNEEYGIGYIKDKEFYFDLEDYNKIKGYTWNFNNKGYIQASITVNSKETKIKLHRLIMNCTNSKIQIDHINRNKVDNRKENLRECTNYENCKNKGIYKSNKSGVTGVYFDNNKNDWVAQIRDKYKTIYLGAFEEKEDAIICRLKKEKEWLGDLSPQKELFEKYNI